MKKGTFRNAVDTAILLGATVALDLAIIAHSGYKFWVEGQEFSLVELCLSALLLALGLWLHARLKHQVDAHENTQAQAQVEEK